MKQTLIELRELRVGYSRPVAGPISLTVSEGEVIGLQGPNGSGKSTVLAAITGASRVFSGEIWRPEGLKVAHQHQRFPRLPEMPFLGREFLPLLDCSIDSVPRAVAPTLEKRLDMLSGGQLQFLQVWACVGSPAGLVLLDEPTNNMDPEAVDALAELLRQRDSRRGMIVVSHEDEFLYRVCTRTVSIQAVAV